MRQIGTLPVVLTIDQLTNAWLGGLAALQKGMAADPEKSGSGPPPGRGPGSEKGDERDDVNHRDTGPARRPPGPFGQPTPGRVVLKGPVLGRRVLRPLRRGVPGLRDLS